MARGAWGLVCILLFCGAVYALDPNKAITQYTSDVWVAEQGLPQNSVQAIVQTKDDYIWLGTQQGIARFDGVTFTTFNKENTPGFTNNAVWALCVDHEGTLWIGTYGGGVVRYRDGVFTPFGSGRGLSNDLVRVIYEDSHHNLWVGTRGGGLNRLVDGKFTAITTREGLSSDIVRAIAEDSDGNLWVGTDSGLNKIRDGKIQVYTTRDGLKNDGVWSIHQSRNGRLWFGTQGGGLNYLENDKFLALTTADGLPG